MRRVLGVLLLLASASLVACAGKDSGGDVVASGSSTTEATAAAGNDANTFNTTMVNGKPHFATPEDAMRFLAQAWNNRDTVNLKHVTDPGARDELDAMHGVAVNLRLNHCDENKDAGDYTCYFDHDYPPHASTTMPEHHDGPTGQAVFLVGPADTPGWYMTVFESCS